MGAPSRVQSTIITKSLFLTGFGYSLTTLNKNYNPKSLDESWVCVFCRQPSHYNGLGDLFGPYYIPTEQWKKLNLPSPQKANVSASSFILGGSGQAGAKVNKKVNKKKQESPAKGPSDQSEIWFHEDCICWMPQIRLIGNLLFGSDH